MEILEASLPQLKSTLISPLVTHETNIKQTPFTTALTETANGNRFIMILQLLWSLWKQEQFSRGFTTFQHIFLSIKRNLVCERHTAKKSNLCRKACHSEDMIERSTRLPAWLPCFHQVPPAEPVGNPSVSCSHWIMS